MNDLLRARLTGTQPSPPPPLGALNRPAAQDGLAARLEALEEVVAALTGVDLEWDSDTGEYRERKAKQQPHPVEYDPII